MLRGYALAMPDLYDCGGPSLALAVEAFAVAERS